MNHEDPNHGPAQSPPSPVVIPPSSPSQEAMTPPPPSQPMATPTSLNIQSPPNPPPRPPPEMAGQKLSVKPLEIPPRPSQPGLMLSHSQSMTSSPPLGRSQAEEGPTSPPPFQPHTTTSPKPHIQPLEIPPSPGYQPEVISPIPQVAAMSPKPSLSLQRQSISSTPHRPSFAMSPSSHHPPLMMGPAPLPYYQPYMYPPPPYYHPGTTFNVAMAPAGGFQAPNHNYPEHERAWSTDLFDCTKDIKNCTRTICCPCVTFGQIAEIVNEGTTPWYEPGLLCALLSVFAPCVFIFHSSFPYTACYRTKLRKKYKLRGSVLEDCLVHCFCEFCALCQEFRELDHQGFDVPLGWHENKRRERQAVAVFRFIPPEEQGMTR